MSHLLARFRLTQLGMAWHVLRGGKLIQGATVHGTLVVDQPNTLVTGCTVIADSDQEAAFYGKFGD